MPVDPRDPASIRTLSRGRCFLYVAPCPWEDLLKLGFSRDPLERLQSLHRRWFEFFDLDRALLVETDAVRDARVLESSLRQQLLVHNAPAPLTVQAQAGGEREWYRGAYDGLVARVEALAHQGHRVHAPARPWFRHALEARADLLYAWSSAMLTVDELESRAGPTSAQRAVRDALDAFLALDIPLEERVPAQVYAWYRAGIRAGPA